MKRRQPNRELIAEREAAWRALSPAEQLRHLDMRLGLGRGATKQRRRIQAQMAKDGGQR